MKRPSGGASQAGPAIEILVESTRWKAQPEAAETVRAAVRTAAKTTSTTRSELAIVLTHDSAIRKLNRQWRGFDKPTNVLSFPAPADAVTPGPARTRRRSLGDIVIAYETVAREARGERKPFGEHLAHLAVHGYLHLLGHDHENDDEAETMERLETRILARLGIPDPYSDRPATG